MQKALFALLAASSAAVVCASALRSKLFSALRTRVPLLAAVASSSAGASSSNESVRWTVAAEEQVRSALSEETRSILLTAWEQDSELLDFTSRGGRHFAQPLVQEEHGTEMHHTLAWAEDGGLPKAAGRPGVLLVHTAVGPQDLWLRWRASRIHNMQVNLHTHRLKDD